VMEESFGHAQASCPPRTPRSCWRCKPDWSSPWPTSPPPTPSTCRPS
jgi:hypothetical protein